MYNNLFLSNKADRDGGAVVCTDGSEPSLANCTLVSNTATGSGFATGSGGAFSVTAGSRAHIENCLLWDNYAFVGPQVSLVDPNGGHSYQYSSAIVSYCLIQSGQTGIKTDAGSYLTYETNNVEGSNPPLFVSLESMTPYAYTDERFITNYSISVKGAAFTEGALRGTLQDVNSPCINKGSVDIDNPDTSEQPLLPLGRYAYTLRTDGERDESKIDIGYHRRKAGVYPRGDIDYSGAVNILDYEAMSDFWLVNTCAYPDWCEGADLNHDGDVNNVDYALLAQLYGAGDVTAPIPNPSQWSMAPAASSGSEIIMTAATATDNSGNTVEYMFEIIDANSGGHSSGWQTDTTYTDGGLATGHDYGYRVKARDENHNETAWSPILYAFVGEDGRPPSPNPSQWEKVPYATSATSIAMIARRAVDASGVEYHFRCESGNNGYDSGWQASPAFININLLPSTTYTYTVETRDGTGNTGALSPQASATTLLSPDITPPVPTQAQWFLRPVGVSTTSITMMAMTAYDISGVEYYFECTFGGHDHDSGWQQLPGYTATGLLESTRYDFRLLVRDRSVARNACVPTEIVSAWTLSSGGGGPGPGPGVLIPPTPNPMTWAATSAITVTGTPLTNGIPTQILATETATGLYGYWHCMTAAKAVDYTGSSIGVEYYFQCVTDNKHSSGWILGDPTATTGPGYPVYVGSPGWPRALVWRVKARDIWGTETSWSPAVIAGGIPF